MREGGMKGKEAAEGVEGVEGVAEWRASERREHIPGLGASFAVVSDRGEQAVDRVVAACRSRENQAVHGLVYQVHGVGGVTVRAPPHVDVERAVPANGRSVRPRGSSAVRVRKEGTGGAVEWRGRSGSQLPARHSPYIGISATPAFRSCTSVKCEWQCSIVRHCRVDIPLAQ